MCTRNSAQYLTVLMWIPVSLFKLVHLKYSADKENCTLGDAHNSKGHTLSHADIQLQS